MSVEDVVGRCRVVPRGYPTGAPPWGPGPALAGPGWAPAAVRCLVKPRRLACLTRRRDATPSSPTHPPTKPAASRAPRRPQASTRSSAWAPSAARAASSVPRPTCRCPLSWRRPRRPPTPPRPARRATRVRSWSGPGLGGGWHDGALLPVPAPLPPSAAAFVPPHSPACHPPRGAGKGKAAAAEEAAPASRFPGDDGVALATMDIFAGCGGLSEGMHQAGAWRRRWAAPAVGGSSRRLGTCWLVRPCSPASSNRLCSRPARPAPAPQAPR